MIKCLSKTDNIISDISFSILPLFYPLLFIQNLGPGPGYDERCIAPTVINGNRGNLFVYRRLPYFIHYNRADFAGDMFFFRASRKQKIINGKVMLDITNITAKHKVCIDHLNDLSTFNYRVTKYCFYEN